MSGVRLYRRRVGFNPCLILGLSSADGGMTVGL